MTSTGDQIINLFEEKTRLNSNRIFAIEIFVTSVCTNSYIQTHTHTNLFTYSNLHTCAYYTHKPLHTLTYLYLWCTHIHTQSIPLSVFTLTYSCKLLKTCSTVRCALQTAADLIQLKYYRRNIVGRTSVVLNCFAPFI